jgi:hypothetical protein
MFTPCSPTAVMKPSRSSALVRISTVPPTSSSTMSCELQPVTWNSGTDTSVEVSGPSARSTPMTRIAVSEFARKFSCDVIAPFGKPVVPLV